MSEPKVGEGEERTDSNEGSREREAEKNDVTEELRDNALGADGTRSNSVGGARFFSDDEERSNPDDEERSNPDDDSRFNLLDSAISSLIAIASNNRSNPEALSKSKSLAAFASVVESNFRHFSELNPLIFYIIYT